MSDTTKCSGVSRHLVAGFSGGLTSAVCLQPLDLLKTRVQQSSHSSITTVIKELNGISQLWRGTLPSALRTSIGSGLYLTSLNVLRSWLAGMKLNNNQLIIQKSSSSLPKLSARENLFSGIVARTVVGFITMPITILKIRFESNLYNYKSLWEATKSIKQSEGITGFFTGFGATAARDAPYAGLYILFYEQMKVLTPFILPSNVDNKTIGNDNNNDNLNSNLFNTSKSAIINSVSAMSAASLATIVTAPFDTIKTCMQLNPTKYSHFTTTAKDLVINDGWRRLFDGVSLRLVRKAASAGIAWCIYEELIKL